VAYVEVVLGQNSEALRSALNEVTFEPDVQRTSLTSKPELQVRDRLAWRLLRSAHVAGREWKRYQDLE
jgi:hypothetical protein